MKWYSNASYTDLNAWPEINSATQSQRVNQQFEIQRWPLTEVPWRALHKFGRNIGDLTGCKTSLVHYWFVSILTSYCACSCWNYTFTFWFLPGFCPACRTTFIATRFRVAVICPIIPVPHCIRVFFYFVWFVFINHIFQLYYELCTYCNILDIYLS